MEASYSNLKEIRQSQDCFSNGYGEMPQVELKDADDDCEDSTSALTTQERIFNKEKDQFFGHKKTPKIVDFRAFPSAARSGIEPLILP